MATKTDIGLFATYVSMAFHEARNVRHLVKAGHLDSARYRLLITGMPKNRREALKPLRREAANAASAREAESIFRSKFGLSLEDLASMSEDPHWSGTQTGGNRWAQIDRALIELRTAIDQKEEEKTKELLERLPSMRHNTGSLGDKLKSLG